MSHVWAFYRRSTDKQELSISDQRRECQAFAAAHGWEIVREFIPSKGYASGLTIDSTVTPSLDGIYACDSAGETALLGMQAAISAGVFPGYYRFLNGTRVNLNAAQMTAVAVAVMNYIEALDNALATALSGGSWIAPSNTTTIDV